MTYLQKIEQYFLRTNKCYLKAILYLVWLIFHVLILDTSLTFNFAYLLRSEIFVIPCSAKDFSAADTHGLLAKFWMIVIKGTSQLTNDGYKQLGFGPNSSELNRGVDS